MTEGPIWKNIVAFAIPVFIGIFFQQLYNAADSIIGDFPGLSAHVEPQHGSISDLSVEGRLDSHKLIRLREMSYRT